MNRIKCISIYIGIIFSLKVIGQNQKEIVNVTVYKKGCVLNFVFSNRTKNSVTIPDFSLRSDTANGYRVLLNKFIRSKGDTLYIEVNSITNIEDSHEVTIQDRLEKEQIIVKYKDIELRKRNTQYVRIPKDFCLSSYKLFIIIYNGKYLAQYKID